MDIKHYNQPQKRDATFIKPPNTLKAKVGSGGLDDKILDRAQNVIDTNTVDFVPHAEAYLETMMEGIKAAQNAKIDKATDIEPFIAGILYPCTQLKANGAMFHYPLITRIADRFVQFMEVVETIDGDILEIALAFHKTMTLAVHNKALPQTDGLVEELNKACTRYFEKHKKA